MAFRTSNTFVLLSLLFLSVVLARNAAPKNRQILLHSGVIHTTQHPETDHSVYAPTLQWMIHVSAELSNAEKEAINAMISPYSLGVYIPHNTYLLVAPAEAVKRVKSHEKVLWVGAFLPEYKFAPNFEEQLKANPTEPLLVLLPPEQQKTRTIEEAQEVANDWMTAFSQSNKGVSINATAVSPSKIVVKSIPTENTAQVARWIADRPESHWIEVVHRHPFHNNYAGPAMKVNDYTSPLLSAIDNNIDGSSQIVGIADSGLDWASCFFNETIAPNATTNLAAEKVIRYASELTGDGVDASGHGTFVAGIIGGSSNNVSYSKWDGVARNSRFWVFDVTGASDTVDTTNFRERVLDYYDDVLSDNNLDIGVWVFPFGAVDKYYTSFTADIDAFVKENEYTLVVVPSGNTESAGVLTESGLAKNALVVGASQSLPDSLRIPLTGGGSSFNLSNTAMFGTQVLASFSAKGPTADGRIKPDIVAPGQRITSSAKGSCGTETREGTSYAAAVAAGAATLVRDYFTKKYYPLGVLDGDSFAYDLPSAALVKAMIINSGQSLLTGDVDGRGHFISLARNWPSGYQGFGRIELDRVLYISGASNFNLVVEDEPGAALTTGSSHRACFKVNPGAKFVKITLVWSDPPGIPASLHPLINDLDLVVLDKRGNVYRTDTSDGGFDEVNNVEQIYIPNPTPGMYAYVVYGQRIPSGPQRFAIVGTGDMNVDFSSPDAFCNPNYDNATNPTCPNSCSGFGTCKSTSDSGIFNSVCTCSSGHNGVDCSRTSCLNNCGGRGFCDFVTSTCTCLENYDPATGCTQTFPLETPAPQQAPVVVTASASDNLGWYIGVGVIAFFVGALCCVIIGFFGAVKFLEHRRDQAAKSGKVEMN